MQKKSRRMIEFTRLILGVTAILGLAQLGLAQQCDPRIRPVDNPVIQYRARGNRCEGLYQSEVSAAVLDIVGVTDGAFQFALDSKEIIELSAPLSRKQPIAIRAVGIPLKTYYRLDAALQPGETLIWPVNEVLLPQALASSKIGVFGWIGNEQQKTYIPVRTAATSQPGASDGKVRLYVRSSGEVNNVCWRAGDMVNDVISGLCAWQPTPKATYRPGEPIVILLPASASGELYVEITAQNQHGEWIKPTTTARILVGR
ncbi:hypothetical protein U27_04692 [Candidatus Vecturithrix granuli]|uniref:Uncharacterized protein n=1 Tax=Vecturithrix granuli TaxID=1499967 RepID=A0A081BZH0_VECG1|nr:hypothetical protein U27_04692 [Candidatus Vecturithrix granuli]